MLKIEGYKDVQKEVIEYDMYVPINIKFGDGWDRGIDTLLYWETGGSSKELVEAGILKEKKEISTITLVICNKVYEKKWDETSIVRSVEGTPLVSVDCFREDDIFVFDEDILKIYYDEDSISLFFSETKPVTCIKNQNVNFLVDSENNWVGLRVKNISNKDMESFLGALRVIP